MSDKSVGLPVSGSIIGIWRPSLSMFSSTVTKPHSSQTPRWICFIWIICLRRLALVTVSLCSRAASYLKFAYLWCSFFSSSCTMKPKSSSGSPCGNGPFGFPEYCGFVNGWNGCVSLHSCAIAWSRSSTAPERP